MVVCTYRIKPVWSRLPHPHAQEDITRDAMWSMHRGLLGVLVYAVYGDYAEYFDFLPEDTRVLITQVYLRASLLHPELCILIRKAVV